LLNARIKNSELKLSLDEPLPRLTKNPFFKRILDVFMSVGAIFLCLPIVLVTAIAIKLESKGSIFFVQSRYGKDNVPFKIVKFRTMTADGVPISGEEFIQSHSHRITKVGKFLRDTSIDELPQLFNVLQGSMSIVGPRPQPVEQADLYIQKLPEYNLRHAVKPGLTGLVQISDLRTHTDTKVQDYRLLLDIYYINHWSYFTDIYIILRTGLTIIPRYKTHIKMYPNDKVEVASKTKKARKT
jgi:lipopolysaccharide/colanic/teichoic acid biosynthesis glycosyltransferase